MLVLCPSAASLPSTASLAGIHTCECVVGAYACSVSGGLHLQGVQFYPPFRPRDQNKMRLQDGSKQVVEVPIEAILICGSAQKMFVGEQRRGFVPAEGV